MGSTICCFVKNLVLLSLIASLGLFPFAYGGRACDSLGAKATTGLPAGEVELDRAVCTYITTLATLRSYETRNNWYGAQTNISNIIEAANASEQQYGIAFYIGHGEEYYPAWSATHWRIYTSNDSANQGGLVWDRWILFNQSNPPDPQYPPSNHPVRFAFIFSCYQGNVIGGSYNNDSSGRIWYGMPVAWLRTTNITSDGYDFPDGTNSTFIGWYEEAPFLVDPIRDHGTNAQNASYYFLLNFYSSALYRQKTINQALDDASTAVWGSPNFAQTKFRCGFWYTEPSTNETCWLQMVVYGDGGQKLR